MEAQAPAAVILGPRGRGKSTLLRELVGGCRRRIVLDPLNEHGELGRLVTVEELADLVLEHRSGVLQVRCWIQDELDGADVADISLALGRGVLVVDECDRWIHGAPEEPWVEHVERGRHYNVGLFMATRRPARVWRTATANATRIYAFRTMEPRDVAYFKEYAGSEAAAELGRLPRFHYLAVDCETGEVARGVTHRGQVLRLPAAERDEEHHEAERGETDGDVDHRAV